jgi:hypothetical protein
MSNILFYGITTGFLLALAALNASPVASVLIVISALHLGACAGREFCGS